MNVEYDDDMTCYRHVIELRRCGMWNAGGSKWARRDNLAYVSPGWTGTASVCSYCCSSCCSSCYGAASY